MFEPSKDTADNRDASEISFHAGGMDIFTMPQTLVNLGKNETEGRATWVSSQDPFRPLCSIIDFKTSEAGFINTGPSDRSIIREKKASLRLLAHNQSYISHLSPIIKPEERGATKILITYGWSHPDGAKRTSRPSDAQLNNDVGIIIDQCINTETYSVLDSRISFDDAGQANIDLDLSFSSFSSGLGTTKVNSGGDTVTVSELSSQIGGMIDLFAMNRENKTGTDFLVSAFLQVLEDDQVLSSAASRELTNYRKAVVKDLADGRLAADSNTSRGTRRNVNKAGIQHLQSLFLQFFGEKNGDAFLRAAARSNPNSSIQGLIKLLEDKPDPFLRHPDDSNPMKDKAGPSKSALKGYGDPGSPTYISFGKIITSLAGPSLLALEPYTEVQLVFHPFNQSAGGVHTYNIAQFPISFSAFKKWLKGYIKEVGYVSTKNFVNAVARQFIHVGGNSSSYGLRNLKTLEKIDENLYQIYGFADETGIEFEKTSLAPEFVNPSIVMHAQSGPGRSTFNSIRHESFSTPEDNGSLVLRIHVSDGNFTDRAVFRDALQACQTTGVFPKKPRKQTTELSSVNHKIISDTAVKKLQDLEFIKVFEDAASDEEDSPTKKLADEVFNAFQETPSEEGSDGTTLDKPTITSAVENMVKEYYFVKNDRVGTDDVTKSLKELSQQELPGYILTGIEGTGVKQATVQTTQDPRIVTLSLLDGRTPEQKADDAKSGRKILPLSVIPVEIDLTVMGNPFIRPGQEYLVDLKTDTNLDAFYRVMSVEHQIQPGNFETSIKLTASNSAPRYAGGKGNITNFIVSRINAMSDG